MPLDKKIRENLDGKYLIIHSDDFREGIEYAFEMKIHQVQLIGGTENEIDFKYFEKIKDFLKIISFVSLIDNIKNFDTIYSLQKIEKIYFQQKQKFKIDISNFPKIEHLGAEYWKGLINIDKTHSLESLVLSKLPASNLRNFRNCKNCKLFIFIVQK